MSKGSGNDSIKLEHLIRKWWKQKEDNPETRLEDLMTALEDDQMDEKDLATAIWRGMILLLKWLV